MSTDHTTLTYTDPRTFNGDPFEVADRAFEQVEATAALHERALSDAFVMARNAEMERALYAAPNEVPDGDAYARSAAGQRLGSFLDQIKTQIAGLSPLRRAASFNPRRPPKE